MHDLRANLLAVGRRETGGGGGGGGLGGQMSSDRWDCLKVNAVKSLNGQINYMTAHRYFSLSVFALAQTFRSNLDAPSLTVARVGKKYDCFAV